MHKAMEVAQHTQVTAPTEGQDTVGSGRPSLPTRVLWFCRTVRPHSKGHPGFLPCPRSCVYSRVFSGPWFRPSWASPRPVSTGELHLGPDSELRTRMSLSLCLGHTAHGGQGRRPDSPLPAERLEVGKLGPAFLLQSRGAGGAGRPHTGTHIHRHSGGRSRRAHGLIKHCPCACQGETPGPADTEAPQRQCRRRWTVWLRGCQD